MRDALLTWQWSLYPQGHADRVNLTLHLLSAPLFQLGTVTLVSSFWLGWRGALAGGVAMLAALVLQGRGHKMEAVRPVPFEGPVDFVSRFFVEQWVTFPRYVLTGGWARAWREAGKPSGR